MRKTTLLNSELSYEISMSGHTQTICICDSGLPVPNGVKRIDLAVSRGIPSFIDVLSATLSEMCVERAIIAEEFKKQPLYSAVVDLLTASNPSMVLEYVKHDHLKALTTESRAIVRTGEQTPYANILLVSGVTF